MISNSGGEQGGNILLYLLKATCSVSKQTLGAFFLFSGVLAATADADSHHNEDIIASTIQKHSQIPESTLVTVQQCKIEIVVRYSEHNNCSRPQSADFSRTLLSLKEIDEIRIGDAGSGRIALHFIFTSDVSRKLEKATEIWRRDKISDEPTTIDSLEEEPTIQAFGFLHNSNVDYRNEVVDCSGVQHFQINSTTAHFISLTATVPKDFFYSIQEYYSMCKPTSLSN